MLHRELYSIFYNKPKWKRIWEKLYKLSMKKKYIYINHESKPLKKCFWLPMTQIPTLLSNFPEEKTLTNTVGLSFNKINKLMCNVPSGQKLICTKTLLKSTTKLERKRGKHLLSRFLWLKPIFLLFLIEAYLG